MILRAGEWLQRVGIDDIMKQALRIRFRIDFGEECSIGPGKIQLLEAIAASGSLSQAARDMGMSYRRAWLLMDSLNKSFDKPVVNASTGGSGGGGVTVTEFGQQLIKTYQALESILNSAVKKQLHAIELHVVASSSKKADRSIIRKGRSVAKTSRARKR